MCAMLFTAISYGRMARAYPSAGSAFTYVGQELHPGLGYVTGWSMVMDYVLNPMICTIWCSKAAMNFLPRGAVRRAGWSFFAAALHRPEPARRQGQRAHERGARDRHGRRDRALPGRRRCATCSAHAARRGGLSRGRSTIPRPSPGRRCSTGTSIAVLTYIGFDGISTLSEEVENPRRNILLATVLTCLAIGILAAIEVYAGAARLGQLDGLPRRRHRVRPRRRAGRRAAGSSRS